MYEFSIAAKYLTPKWRQLSVSIISLISISVISLVVWLIIVFFSVTNGLTEGWLDKLTALTAPVRISPTRAYYNSYYYLVDELSSQSDYTLKTIGEKLASLESDPYDPDNDAELPLNWRSPDRLSDGSLKDPVKLAFTALDQVKGVPGIAASEFETSAATLNLHLRRRIQNEIPALQPREAPQGELSHAALFGSLDQQNPSLLKAVLKPSGADLSNLLMNFNWESPDFQAEDWPSSLAESKAESKIVREHLHTFFRHVTIHQLITPQGGWQLPEALIPERANWDVVAMERDGVLFKVILPGDASQWKQLQKLKHWHGFTFASAKLSIDGGRYELIHQGRPPKLLPLPPRLYLPEGTLIDVDLLTSSLEGAAEMAKVIFTGRLEIQGAPLAGPVSYGQLEVSNATLKTDFTSPPSLKPFWLWSLIEKGKKPSLNLPSDATFGEGILLPRGFKDTGVLLGDQGHISYPATSPTGIHEVQAPIFVAGFYDPGIIPIGGKYIIASKDLMAQIRPPLNSGEDSLQGNGINVRFDSREQAEYVKDLLQNAFEEAGIAEYWKIETFRDYEFTRDIIQQLQSDKHLFSLLAALIIVVACSNIISMLIILVNDKKEEIGILRSIGANSFSIALIFGSCGVFIGIVGSLTGTLTALITLKNLQPIVNFISWMQGYQMFNPLFYGESLPSDISLETFSFVLAATAVISLIAGIIPATKASLLKPAAILKAE